MKRADLTEKILDLKREKGWTWKHIVGEIGQIRAAGSEQQQREHRDETGDTHQHSPNGTFTDSEQPGCSQRNTSGARRTGPLLLDSLE